MIVSYKLLFFDSTNVLLTRWFWAINSGFETSVKPFYYVTVALSRALARPQWRPQWRESTWLGEMLQVHENSGS